MLIITAHVIHYVAMEFATDIRYLHVAIWKDYPLLKCSQDFGFFLSNASKILLYF